MSSGRLLIVDDDAGMRTALCETLTAEGFDTVAAKNGSGALDVLSRESVDLVLTDVQMPGIDGQALMRSVRELNPIQPVIMMTAFGTIDEAVTSVLDGASHYLVKPFPIKTLLQEIRRLLPTERSTDGPVAEDPAMRRVMQWVAKVGPLDTTVTLSGESGTGKEVIARQIHATSERRDREFIAINCAAIPDNMLEAVLFGHAKGAFTGASADSAGKFEQAQGSTLLLDEISEMDLGLQAKLLRVLQEREVERIGSARRIKLDVRVIATTNRDLENEVAGGRFREDLYYRLNVFPIELPPLRERPRDITPLAKHLLAKHARGRTNLRFSPDALDALQGYRWPGNVRELDNVIQRALVLNSGEQVLPEHLQLPDCAGASSATGTATGPLQDTLQAREASAIQAALTRHAGRRGAAAADLGISPRTLRYKLAKLREAGVIAESYPTTENH